MAYISTGEKGLEKEVYESAREPKVVSRAAADKEKPTPEHSAQVSSWTPKVLPFGTVYPAQFPPAVSEHGETLWCLFQVTNGTASLYSWTLNTDTGGWGGAVPMQDPSGNFLTCSTQPVMLDFNDNLHAILPQGGGVLAHYIYADETRVWTKQTSWSAPSTPFAPSLAIFNDFLYLAYVTSSSQNIMWAFWTQDEGSPTGTWSTPSQIGETTGGPVGIFTLNNQLNIVFGAKNNTGTTLQLVFTPGSTPGTGSWARSTGPPEATGRGVFASASVSESAAFMAFTKHGEQEILMSIWELGSWNVNEDTQQSSIDNPVAVPFQGVLYCFLISTDGSRAMILTTRSLNLPFVPSAWMKYVTDDTTLLSSLAIPGTHDTAAGDSLLYPAWTGIQTQTMDIPGQLYAGIRFLDIRINYTLGIIELVHGYFSLGNTLSGALSDIYSFLQLFPTECIIMSIKCDGDCSDGDQLFPVLQTMLQSNNQYWYQGNDLPTIGQVRGKIVLLHRFDYDFPFGMDISDWPDNSSNFTLNVGNGQSLNGQDYYDVEIDDLTTAVSTKFKAVLAALQRAIVDRGPGDDNIYINYTSANTAPSDFTPWEFATGGQNDGVNTLALSVFKNQGAGHGIIPMDYPEYPNGELITAVIAQNFPPSSPLRPRSSDKWSRANRDVPTATVRSTRSKFALIGKLLSAPLGLILPCLGIFE